MGSWRARGLQGQEAGGPGGWKVRRLEGQGSGGPGEWKVRRLEGQGTYSSFIRTHVICHVLLISTITILSIEALVDFNVLQCLSFEIGRAHV